MKVGTIAQSQTSVFDVAEYILQKHAAAEPDWPAMTAMKLQKLVSTAKPDTSPGRAEPSSRKGSRPGPRGPSALTSRRSPPPPKSSLAWTASPLNGT
ncbi:hypothetical protein GCM10010306_099200 [Streptomyces umbrinus]|nr:hypothetical protein GCM10010306_099200 [Streptomyces umbrinus]